MKYCKDCVGFDECKTTGRTVEFAVGDGVCIDFDERKPQTNADRIRAMSDEELAKILGDKCICPPTSECEKLCGDCDVCWMEWLRHPAEKTINQDHNQGKENDRGIY